MCAAGFRGAGTYRRLLLRSCSTGGNHSSFARTVIRNLMPGNSLSRSRYGLVAWEMLSYTPSPCGAQDENERFFLLCECFRRGETLYRVCSESAYADCGLGRPDSPNFRPTRTPPLSVLCVLTHVCYCLCGPRVFPPYSLLCRAVEVKSFIWKGKAGKLARGGSGTSKEGGINLS